MGIGPAAQAAHDSCTAQYFAANPPPPLVDSPLFWLAFLVIGVGVIWTLARRLD